MVQTWLTSLPDPNILYEDIEALFTTTGGPLILTSKGLIIPNLNFFVGLANLSLVRGSEYSTTPSQNLCDPANATGYGPANIETMMLSLGLISLSWLKVNVKKKTENGHCRNPNHTLPPMCNFGSSFHRELYDDLISLMTKLVSNLKECIPNVITVADSDPVVRQSNDENVTPETNSSNR